MKTYMDLIERLRRLTIQKKFFIIISLVMLMLMFELGTFSLGVKILSGIRAFVGGEGLWSKAQKDAMHYLLEYTENFDESYYQSFRTSLQPILEDRQARLELDKSNPNLHFVRQKFLLGGNHPKDIDDMIFVYRQFRHVKYMSDAINTWVEGDAGIDEFVRISNDLHTIVLASQNSTNPEMFLPQITSLHEDLHVINDKLTILENNFSSTLGKGSRNTRNLLLSIAMMSAIIQGLIIVRVAMIIGQSVDEIDRAKSEFTSLAAHQLRTPITSIKWYIEMLQSDDFGSLNDQQKELLREVYNSSKNMVQLINDLLNTSRSESGRIKIEPIATDLVAFIQEILKEIEPLSLEKQCAVSFEFPKSNISKLNIDRTLFRQVVENLLSNAIHYSSIGKKGRVTVTLAVSPKEKTIYVKDNGIGISKESQKKIFQKFFRDDAVRSIASIKGNGLGLYLAKKIMDASNGTIGFHSELGKGSTFYITIPSTGMRAKKGEVGLSG